MTDTRFAGVRFFTYLCGDEQNKTDNDNLLPVCPEPAGTGH